MMACSVSKEVSGINTTMRRLIWLALQVFFSVPITCGLFDINEAINFIIRFTQIPDILEDRDPEFNNNAPSGDNYDFIVIGAGPGGSVVTNRLTEDYDTTVLLIEAGREDTTWSDIPLLNPLMVFTDYNWRYFSDYSPDICRGMQRSICPWPAGKGLGGGTILNGMIYTRGNYRDFDEWAAEGNQGWSYKEVLPYFIKAETTYIKGLKNSPYRGQQGPVTVSYSPSMTTLGQAFLESGQSLGYRLVDYNNPNSHVGFSRIQFSMRHGMRVSAGTAYLRPIRNRRNFHIALRSRVTKILINQETKRAYGVIYVQNGKERIVYARKEVILSAGTFNTPQLLMLSGIGHADHLTEMGIPVIQDLPVGDNLMEHVGMHGLTFLVNETNSIIFSRAIREIMGLTIQYLIKGKGLGTNAGCESIAYVQTKYANEIDRPDIELLQVNAAFTTDAGALFRKSFGVSDELYDAVYRKADVVDAFTIWPMLLYPRSRGFVRLFNNNPLSKVRIQSNFLKERIDMDVLIEGIKMAINITEQPAFQRYGARLLDVPFPNCMEMEFGSDEYWECTIRTMTTQFHHPSGTCRMGAVVDERLRVYGISGLRVVDASVMPSIPGSHTQAATYMIGEKGAVLIKEDWSL